MWPEIVRLARSFDTAVLTGLDPEGCPFSVRCRAQPDEATHTLRLAGFSAGPIQPGPASLLWHSFDRLLWNLRSGAVRGRIEWESEAWRFYPEVLVAGAGMRPFDQLRTLIECRRRAARYLRLRGLPRPAVPWDEIQRLHRAADKQRELR